jgi:hypothetical protein
MMYQDKNQKQIQNEQTFKEQRMYRLQSSIQQSINIMDQKQKQILIKETIEQELAMLENPSIKMFQPCFELKDDGFNLKLKLETSYNDFFWYFLDSQEQWFKKEINSLITTQIINPISSSQENNLDNSKTSVNFHRGSIEIGIKFIAANAPTILNTVGGIATVISAYPAVKEIVGDLNDPLGSFTSSLQNFLSSFAKDVGDLWAWIRAFYKYVSVPDIDDNFKKKVIDVYMGHYRKDKKPLAPNYQLIKKWQDKAGREEHIAFMYYLLEETRLASLKPYGRKFDRDEITQVIDNCHEEWFTTGSAIYTRTKENTKPKGIINRLKRFFTDV